jgi:hypothetical protein
MLVDEERKKWSRRLDAVADKIKERFGTGAIRHGTGPKSWREPDPSRKGTGGRASRGGAPW